VTLRDKLDWRLQAELRYPAEGDLSPAASEKDRER
jgi:hypothetical protein